MQRHKLTADQAFQVLARASMKVHTKVCKVADHLVHTGELPHRRAITPMDPTAARNP
jgi:AmiR/NasT family two-component response regulator